MAPSGSSSHPARDEREVREAYPPSVDEVSRRLELYDRTKDPTAMWPGLTEQTRVAAAREIERVVRGVLLGRTGIRLDPDGAHDAYALAIAGHTTGMAPLLGHWIATGAVTASASVARRLAEYLDHARRRSARMEREVLPAFDALAERGIQTLVLKGFHTARVYFEEPALRRMADVDMMVSADRIDDAESALRAAGFRPASSRLRPYKRDWVRDDIDQRIFSLEFPDERTRWMLELHTSHDRVYHPGATARLDSERDCVERMTLAGRSLFVVNQPLLLISLACHCSQELDGSRLLRLFELVQVIRADGARGRLDWDEVLAMLERTRAARYTYPALALVEELAPGTVDSRALSLGYRESTWAARHTVARLAPAGGSLDSRGVVRQLMWTRGPLAVAQRIARTFWPAAFTGTEGLAVGWRARVRRVRAGLLSLRAPNEREGALTPDPASPTVPAPKSNATRS